MADLKTVTRDKARKQKIFTDVTSALSYHRIYNPEAEVQQSSPVSYDPYIPNEKEERLWSRLVKVPKRPYARLCYRVREDYYKVTEIYTDKNIEVPDIRLIGTDIIVHHTDPDGTFAYVVELETKVEHKIYFKFLRMLAPEEVFIPNKWVFYTCKVSIAPKKLIEDYSKPKIRFKVEMRGSLIILMMYRSSLNVLENNRQILYCYSSEDLETLLIEAIVWVIEDRGYLTPQELRLYNDIICGRIFENLFVQEILNKSTRIIPQDF